MKGKEKEAGALRRRAEERLAGREGEEPAAPTADRPGLVHELQVHQIELEIQNEELRRTQEEAEEQRRRYQDLYDFAPVGYLSLDATGKVTAANLAAATLLGWERHRVVGSPLFVFLAPESRGEYDTFLRRLAAGGTGTRCEVRLGANAKRQGWLLLEGGAIEATGQPAVMLLDITERKQTEEALHREKGFTDAVINSMPGIFYVFDHQERLVRWNRRLEEFSGHSPDEMTALRPHNFVAAEDHGLLESRLREVLVNRCDSNAELRLLDRDGNKVPFHCTGSPMKVGDTIYLIGLGIDISKRVHMEKALRESEERFRALYRDNPTMIAILDADFTMLSVNPFCAGQLGYAVKELEGRSMLEVFHEEDRPAVAEQLRRCLRTPGRVRRWQFRKVRKDGVLLWVDETAQAVYDLEGALTILIVCQDITERKRAEAEIEQLNTQLAARAAELEAANRELEAFNYTVAHDLRGPLNLISSYCQFIQELCSAKVDESCQGYIEETYKGTLRMSNLIDALLNFSKLSHVEPDRQENDLCALAQEIAAELQITQPERRCAFRVMEGITAYGDPKLLRIALANLLGNAWKYTGERDEAVIEFGARDIDGSTAYFVRDNGVGFEPEDAEKLFLPFQRLRGPHQFKGFGVGLATVERIIRRHGGRVWAEGEPGKGATVYFTLPTAYEAGSRSNHRGIST